MKFGFDWPSGVRRSLKMVTDGHQRMPILHIMQMCPCNVYPLTPHFYIEKLGFTGVFVIFSFFALQHKLWVLVSTASLRRF